VKDRAVEIKGEQAHVFAYSLESVVELGDAYW